jgi:hypothetical protein
MLIASFWPQNEESRRITRTWRSSPIRSTPRNPTHIPKFGSRLHQGLNPCWNRKDNRNKLPLLTFDNGFSGPRTQGPDKWRITPSPLAPFFFESIKSSRAWERTGIIVEMKLLLESGHQFRWCEPITHLILVTWIKSGLLTLHRYAKSPLSSLGGLYDVAARNMVSINL